MFKTKSTPEKVRLVKALFPNKTYTVDCEYLAFTPVGNKHGWVMEDSINGGKFITIHEISQDNLTQLVLLHSIGFTPKEIAEIINE